MAHRTLPRVVPLSHHTETLEPITRAALYARFSTAHNRQDSTMQMRELEEYCRHHCSETNVRPLRR